MKITKKSQHFGDQTYVITAFVRLQMMDNERVWSQKKNEEGPSNDQTSLVAGKSQKNICASILAKSSGEGCLTMSRPEILKFKIHKYFQHERNPNLFCTCEVCHSLTSCLCNFQL